MIDYSWLKNTQAAQPTDEARAAFALARADQHEAIAAEWASKGDERQADLWRASAASLRGEAA
jgi:hypothetical protein